MCGNENECQKNERRQAQFIRKERKIRCEIIIVEEQHWRGTVGIVLKEIQTESFKHKKRYAPFVHFKQAYDKADIEQLLEALKEQNTQDEIIAMINLTIQKAEQQSNQNQLKKK